MRGRPPSDPHRDQLLAVAVALGVREGYTAEAVARALLRRRARGDPMLPMRTPRRVLQIYRRRATTPLSSAELARLRRLRDKLGRLHFNARAVRAAKARLSNRVGAGTAALFNLDGASGAPEPHAGPGPSDQLVELLLIEAALRARRPPTYGAPGAGTRALFAHPQIGKPRRITLLTRRSTLLTEKKSGN